MDFQLFGGWRHRARAALARLALPSGRPDPPGPRATSLDSALRQAACVDGAAGLIGDVFGACVTCRPAPWRDARWAAAGWKPCPERRPRCPWRWCLRSSAKLTITERFGVEDLLALFAAGEIALHRDAGAEFVRSEQRLERGVDLGDQVALDLWRYSSSAVARLRCRPARRPLRGRLSRLPRMSSTETASGASPSTALATRWLMATTFCGASCAPGSKLTSTLALAGCRDSRNTESLGKVTWTRACSTSASDITCAPVRLRARGGS